MIMIQRTDYIIPVNQIIGIKSRVWIKENGDLVVLSVVVLHMFERGFSGEELIQPLGSVNKRL